MIEQVTSTGPDGAVSIAYSDGRGPVATNINLPADTAARIDLHAWLDGGGTIQPRATQPATSDDYRYAIQAHVDATAQQRSYDSGITCASYVNSTVPAWASQAAIFVAWRDAVWAYAYSELAKVEGGQRPQPTVEAIVSELPLITWQA
ncbi:hypothetical protein [Bosea sp. 2RAB26]|uniref:hypothetical protein n=1 Tax=Bosea sp. 2RAB26 TaxID=3237476 RepID=UPI003F9097BA